MPCNSEKKGILTLKNILQVRGVYGDAGTNSDNSVCK